MLAFTLRRLIYAVLTFFGLTYIVWLLTTREGVLTIHSLSLRGMLPPHYLTWLNNVLHGNLGYSINAQMPVANALQSFLPVSLLVIIPAFLLQQGVAIGFGLTAGTRYRTSFDRFFTSVCTILSSIPNFVLAVLAILIFADIMHILPATGLVDLHTTGAIFGTPQYWDYFKQHTVAEIADIISHLIMPVILVAIAGVATDAQLVRLAMVEVLQEDYIRSAWSHGLPKWRVYWRHALRNVLVPLITNIGIQIPRLIFVAAIIELIFGLPGLGSLFIQAVYTPVNARDAVAPRDYDVVSAYFVVLGGIALLSAIVTDLSYAVTDPRIRRTSSSPTYAPNPLVTGRPLLKLGRFTVTAGTVATTALVIFGLVVTGFSIRQVAFHKPTIAGTWSGTINTAGYNLPAYLDIHVDDGGSISGTAYACPALAGATQAGSFHVTGDTDFDSAIHMEWQGPDAAFLIDGGYPSDNHQMTFQGTYASSDRAQSVIDPSTLQRVAALNIDIKTFCTRA
jgi:peptide/nickel transport system permease protein